MKLTRMGAALLAASMFAGCDAMNKKDEKKDAKPSASPSPAAGASPAPAAQPAAMDMTPYMMAFSPVPAWPKDGAGLKQGWWVSQKTTSNVGGTTTTSESKYSVVGMAGDDVKVEVSPMPGYKDYVEAYVAKKGTGEVSWAGAGHKGEKPKDIKIQKAGGAAGTAPTGTDEDVTVKAGTFKAKKFVTPGVSGGPESTSWMGTDGDTKDVMLKSTYGTTTTELTDAPAMEDMTIGGKTMKVKHLKYSNGMEQWVMADMWPFVGNLAKMTMAGTTTEVTGTGEDAKPELTWEAK